MLVVVGIYYIDIFFQICSC